MYGFFILQGGRKMENGIASSFLVLLTLIFATAKVFGFSTMSWFWVFSPILIPLLLGLTLIFIACVLCVLKYLFMKLKR